MITGVGLICVFVLDMKEARAFYTEKLGLQVGVDMVRDGFRWLTVHSPRQPQLPIMLVDPSAAVMDTEKAEQIKSLVATGYLGPGALTTDDCVATFHELKARVSSSSKSRKSGSTASTPASATRSATTGGSPSRS
jgi:catechol 2,3-dioxygenase-like lactoylglutathione lyase family enzyme